MILLFLLLGTYRLKKFHMNSIKVVVVAEAVVIILAAPVEEVPVEAAALAEEAALQRLQ
jgi:hypothetical protein